MEHYSITQLRYVDNPSIIGDHAEDFSDPKEETEYYISLSINQRPSLRGQPLQRPWQLPVRHQEPAVTKIAL